MSDPGSQSRLVVTTMAIHRIFTASIAFGVGVVVLGGPFGLAPALAALIAEMADWIDGRNSAYGVLGRFVHRATSMWRSAASVGLIALGVVGLYAANFLFPSPMTAVMLVVGGLWAVMLVHHAALRLALSLPALPNSLERLGFEMLLLGWWHLLAVASWIVLLVWALPWAPVPVIALGPGMLVCGLIALVLPVARRLLKPDDTPPF